MSGIIITVSENLDSIIILVIIIFIIITVNQISLSTPMANPVAENVNIKVF